jgi:hypothetical protein
LWDPSEQQKGNEAAGEAPPAVRFRANADLRKALLRLFYADPWPESYNNICVEFFLDPKYLQGVYGRLRQHPTLKAELVGISRCDARSLLAARYCAGNALG